MWVVNGFRLEHGVASVAERRGDSLTMSFARGTIPSLPAILLALVLAVLVFAITWIVVVINVFAAGPRGAAAVRGNRRGCVVPRAVVDITAEMWWIQDGHRNLPYVLALPCCVRSGGRVFMVKMRFVSRIAPLLLFPIDELIRRVLNVWLAHWIMIG